MFYRAFAILVVMMMLAVPTTARATVMLTVENGQLVSAWGVEVLVNGQVQVLDVEFKDGSCIAVFDGCDDSGDFYFGGDASAADAAAEALLDQVFIDGPAGNFDTSPELITGCEANDIFEDACIALTPVFINFDTVSGSFAYNTNNVFPNSDFIDGGPMLERDDSTEEIPWFTWAVWSESDVTVPEPPALTLLLVGLAGLGWLTRGIRQTT